MKPTADEALQGPVRRRVDQFRAIYQIQSLEMPECGPELSDGVRRWPRVASGVSVAVGATCTVADARQIPGVMCDGEVCNDTDAQREARDYYRCGGC